jgi:adenine-specific DNA-methyltransferase
MCAGPEKAGEHLLPVGARIFGDVSLTKPGPGRKFEIKFKGRVFNSGKRWWGTTEESLARTLKTGRVDQFGNALRQLRFQDESIAVAVGNLWDGFLGQTDPIYVVQTNVDIVQRCILMTTDPGDLVLDPTCGSGTTATVAEQWGRRWITIDTSRVALALARARVMGARYPYYLLADSRDGQVKEAEVTRSAVSTKPAHGNIRHGFVYERVPHITLKAIANNAEIDVIWEKWQQTLEPLRASLNKALKQKWEEWEIPRHAETAWDEDAQELLEKIRAEQEKGDEADPAKLRRNLEALNSQLKRSYKLDKLPERPGDPWPEKPTQLHSQWWAARIARQKEIDASIAAKAEFEYLYDKPYEDKKRVRVAGPFTVESLSPHRMLGVDENDDLIDPVKQKTSGGQQSFAQMILDNLKVAGGPTSAQGRPSCLHGTRSLAGPECLRRGALL